MIKNLYILYVVCMLNISVYAKGVTFEGEWQRDLHAQGKEIEVKPNVFYSQFGQDKFIYETYFKNKKDGVFVEFGIADGVYFSNSLFFEKTLGWKGLLVEPIPVFYNQLVKNREAICVHGCVSDKPQTVTFLQAGTENVDFMLWSCILEYTPQAHIHRIQKHLKDVNGTCITYPVNCYLLNNLLQQNNFYHIDYLSIDVECAELGILRSIDFDKYDIDVIGVEGNFEAAEIKEFLISKGYDYITYMGDYIYKKRNNT